MTPKADAGVQGRHWASGLKVVFGLLTCWLLGHVASAQALGTAFTYQGQLKDSGLPATGVYDFEFKLFDAFSGGAQVGATFLAGDVAVSQGAFSVKLDFGSAFTGQARFLEIGVRPGVSGGAYTMLSARQELTPTPTSLYAVSATTINGLVCTNGQVPKWSAGSWTCGAATDPISLGARVFKTAPMTGASFSMNTVAGTNVCGLATFHPCTAWEAMALDALSDTAVFDQQGWVAGAFPNMEEHMRSLANGQNSLVCPLGSNISKFPSTFNHAGTAFPGGIHCFLDSISLPVWCCRNKS